MAETDRPVVGQPNRRYVEVTRHGRTARVDGAYLTKYAKDFGVKNPDATLYVTNGSQTRMVDGANLHGMLSSGWSVVDTEMSAPKPQAPQQSAAPQPKKRTGGVFGRLKDYGDETIRKSEELARKAEETKYLTGYAGDDGYDAHKAIESVSSPENFHRTHARVRVSPNRTKTNLGTLVKEDAVVQAREVLQGRGDQSPESRSRSAQTIMNTALEQDFGGAKRKLVDAEDVKAAQNVQYSEAKIDNAITDAENIVGSVADKTLLNVKDAISRSYAAANQDFFDTTKGNISTWGSMAANWDISRRKHATPEKMLDALNKELGQVVKSSFGDKGADIAAAAKAAGMTVREYSRKIMLPTLQEQLGAQLFDELVKEGMPKNDAEYLIREATSGIIANLVKAVTSTPMEKQIRGEIDRRLATGEGEYKPNMLVQSVGIGIQMATDMPAMGVTGKAISGVAKMAAPVSRSVLATRALRAANTPFWRGLWSGVGQNALVSYANFGLYNAESLIASNLSTGQQTTMSQIGSSLFLESIPGLLIGPVNTVWSNLTRKVGVSGFERKFSKQFWGNALSRFGVNLTGVALEGGTFTLGDWLIGKYGDNAPGVMDYIENTMMVAAMKASNGRWLTHPTEFIKDSMRMRIDPRLRFSKEVQEEFDTEKGEEFWNFVNDLYKQGEEVMTADVRAQIAKNAKSDKAAELEAKATAMRNLYDGMTQGLSWDAINVLNLGIFNVVASTRPRMQSLVLQDGVSYELAADGTVLSVKKTPTMDEHMAWLKNRSNLQLQGDVRTLMGQAIEKEVSRIMGQDPNSQGMEEAAMDFMRGKLGETTDQATLDDLAKKMVDGKTKEGQEFRQYLLGKSRVNEVIKSLMEDADIKEREITDAMSIDPADMTYWDEHILRELQRRLDEIVNPEGEVHVDASRIGGADDARKSGAGTGNPNPDMLAELDAKRKQTGETFMQWLNGGSEEAQLAKQEGIDANTDVNRLFEVYVDLVQQGYTKEKLAAFGEYINAVARHEGFLAGVATNVEETVNRWGELVKNVDMPDKVIMMVDMDGKTWYMKSGQISVNSDTGSISTDEVGIILVDGEGNVRPTDGRDMKYIGISDIEEAKDARRKELMQGDENENAGGGNAGGSEEGEGTAEEGGETPPAEEGKEEGKGGEGESEEKTPTETEEEKAAREEAERKRIAAEEEERRKKEEEEQRKAKEEAERKAAEEEAERKRKAEAEAAAEEERKRKAAEEEARRKAEEEKAAAEAERIRKEEEAKAEAERKRKEEEERKAAEEAEAARQKEIKEKEAIINADTETDGDQKQAALDYLHGESSSHLDKMTYDAIMRRHKENQERNNPVNKAKKALEGYKADGIEVAEATENEDGSIDCIAKFKGKESRFKIKLDYDEEEGYIVHDVEAEYKDIPIDELQKLSDEFPSGEEHDWDERIIDIDEDKHVLTFTSLDNAIDFERWRERKPIMDEAMSNIDKAIGKIPDGKGKLTKRTLERLKEAIDDDSAVSMLECAHQVRLYAQQEGVDLKDISRDIDNIIETAKGMGYEIVDKFKVGDKYNGGASVLGRKTDSSLPPGEIVVDEVTLPEISLNGKKYKDATVVLRQSGKAAPFDPNKPLTEEEKERSKTFDELKEKQDEVLSDIKPKGKLKFNVKDYDGGKLGKGFTHGVYHDEEGYGVITNGEILYFDKELYDESHKGEIVSTGAVKTHPEGTIIEVRLPNGKKYVNWKGVLPKEDTPRLTFSFNPSELTGMLAAYKAAAIKGVSQHLLYVRLPDGRTATMTLENMLRFAKAAENLGADKVSLYLQEGKNLELIPDYFYAESDKGGVLAKNWSEPLAVDGAAKESTKEIIGSQSFLIDLKGYQSAVPKPAPKTPRTTTRPKTTKPETPTETAERIDRDRRREKADKTGGSLSKREERAREDQSRVDAAKEEARTLLNSFVKDFINASKEGASISIVGMNNKQLEVFLKMLSASAKLGYELSRQGFHKFEDWSRELLSCIGDILKEGIGWNDKDLEDFSRELWSYKYTDENKQRRKLSEHAEAFAKAKAEEPKEVDERTEKENDFVTAIGSTMRARLKSGKEALTLKELRDMAKEIGLEDVSDTDLQEFAETAAVMQARRALEDTSHEINHDEYSEVVTLHDKQPALNKRDSDRVEKQQYSTPTPMAAAMAAFCGKGRSRGSQSVLEPSAGNGALTIGFPRENVHVNEIDLARANNLRRQGFVTVTTQDGTKPFSGKYDVVVTNPPFSTPGEKLEPIVRDGFTISGLDGQMAINALDAMRDDGRAAIIVGGHTKYNERGVIVGKDRDFLGYLYQHYNVVDVINMDGSLYGKNGTKYPTRMILIDGRRTDTSERRYAPVKEKARAEAVTSFEELWERVNEHELKERKEKDVLQTTNGDGSGSHHPVAEGGEKADGSGIGGYADGNDNTGVRGGQSGVHSQHDSGLPGRGRGRGSETKSGPVASQEDGGRPGGEGEFGTGDIAQHGTGVDSTKDGEGQRRSTRTGGGREDGGTSGGRPLEAGTDNNDIHSGGLVGGREPEKKAEEKVGLGTEKTDYQPRSAGNSLGTKIPADMVKATQETLKKIGDVDKYVQEKLGYGSKEELFSHLGAEQIDSVAAAIYQMEQGNGFIIGDGTGVGKGRQAAALLRYAIRQGKAPVFVTQKSSLFTDIYRDMLDIGSGEDFHPLIINTGDKDTNITMWDEKQGKRVVVFRGLEKAADVDSILRTLRSTGKLPEGYNCVLMTYSQVGAGTTEYNVDGTTRQKRPRNGQSGFARNQNNGDKKRELLTLLARNNILVLDESHTAAGNATGFFLPLLREAAGVTYLSGTFAKRPDSMPLYAIRTAIAKGVDNVLALMEAVRRGGVTLQEIMSQQLAKAGQMMRRERPTEGVTNNWLKAEDEARVTEEKQRADTMSDLFRSIIDFEETFVEPYLEIIRDNIRVQQGNTKKRSSKMGIGGQPFASKAYNLVRQMSLALKVDAATDRAMQALREGRKPIIAVSNTMESFFDGIPRDVPIPMPDFAETMLRGLTATLDYTEKHPGEPSVKHHINLKDLGSEAEAAYHSLEARIRETSSGMTLSPIDAMVMKLTAAGYKVGELTGRNDMLVETGDGMVKCVRRTLTDKKLIAEQFNTGKLDVLIVNKSSSTGISLHAGARAPGVNIKDCDTRQREMIFAQLETDINDAIQLLGRINRTGQVHPAIYSYLTTSVPAESRLLMMYKAKLKSLFANTTGNQKNEDTDVDVTDIINKYGDQVVAEYFIENPELYDRLGDPFKTGWTVEMTADQKRESIGRMADLDRDGKWASTTLSYLSLLPVEEQIKVIDEISERYNAKLEILNEAGENTLVMNELPLRARTISREVVKEGSEPEGDNPFADNTYAETIECDVLTKPMHRSEVDKVISRMSGGASPEEHRKNVLEQLQTKKEQSKESLRERYQKKLSEEPEQAGKRERRRLVKERKEGKNTYTDERIDELVEFTVNEKRHELEQELKNGLIAVDERFEQFEYCVESYLPGDPVSIPYYVRGELEQGGPVRPAILLGWNISKSMSPSSCSAVFATNDGRRKVTIVFSDIPSWKAIAIETQKYMKDIRILTQESNWEKYAKGGDLRERRVMYTGNLLAVLGSETPVAGRIVRYTTEDGEVRTGVLLQEGAEVSYFGKKVPISSCLDDIKKLRPDVPFASDNGEVTIRKTHNGIYSISVPKSTSRGGRYFLDKGLRDLVYNRQFTSIGDTMRAVFEERNLSAVLDRLSTEHKITITLNGERGNAGESRRDGDVLYRVDEEEELSQGFSSAKYRSVESPTNGDVTEYAIERYQNDDAFQGGTMYRLKDVDSGFYGAYDTKDKLVDAMRMKFPNKRIMLSEDGKSVIVSEFDNEVKKGKKYDAYIERKFERAHKLVEEQSDKLGLDIDVVVDESNLTEKQKNSKGWYDPATGKIVINLNRHHNEFDIKRTILHEGVAHHGLRKMLGKVFDNVMRGIYRDLGRDVQQRVEALGKRLGITDKVTMLEEYMARLAEDMNFDVDGYHIWAKIGYHLRNALRGVGFNIDLSDNDLRYLLWRSHENLKNSQGKGKVEADKLYNDWDAVATAHRVAMEDLWGKPDKMMREDNSTFGNKGVYDLAASPVKEERQLLYNVGDPKPYDTPEGLAQRRAYEKALGESSFYWHEAHVDSMKSLEELVKALTGLKDTRKLLDAHNAYVKAIHMTSVIRASFDEVERTHFKPLMGNINKCVDVVRKATGMSRMDSYDLVHDMIWMKSGMERNRVFWVRDWLDRMQKRVIDSRDDLVSDEARTDYDNMERNTDFTGMSKEEIARTKRALAKEAHLNWIRNVDEEWKKERARLLNELENKNIDLKEYFEGMDTWIKNKNSHYIAGRKDYSGLTSTGHISGKNLNYDAIVREVMDNESILGEALVKDLWTDVRKLTSFSLERSYDGGLLTQGLHDHIAGMMDWYVPMRLWGETMAEDVYSYMTSERDPNAGGTITARAGGRRDRSEDVLAVAMQMCYNSISSAERNKTKQALWRLANETNTADGLVSLSDAWEELIGGEWVPVYAETYDNMTGEEIAKAVKEFNDRMEQGLINGTARKMKSGRLNIAFRFQRGSHKNEHIVEVEVGGVPKLLYLNSNPRAAQAINGQLDSRNSDMRNAMGFVNRYLAATMTSWNPKFTFRNLGRDRSFASWNLYCKNGAAYCGKFNLNWLKNVFLTPSIWRHYLNGTLDTRKKSHRLFDEFIRNGGRTGYVETHRIEGIKEEIQNCLNKGTIKEAAKSGGGWALTMLEHFNAWAENVARFSAYETSRNSGRSILRSIADAKDASTNFNRHGAGIQTAHDAKTFNQKAAGVSAETARSLWLFVNPAMQSLSIVKKNFSEHPVRASVSTMMHAALGAVWADVMYWWVNTFFDDEDKEKYAAGRKYENIPEWDRRANMCVYAGEGKWLKIPFGIEPSAIWGLGEIFATHYLGHKELDDGSDVVLDCMKQMTQLLPVNPLSAATGTDDDKLNILVSVTPSIAAPMMQNITNTKWMGQPIEKDKSFYNRHDAAHTRAFSGTSQAAVQLCQWLSDLTSEYGDSEIEKGSLDISPGKMENTIRGYSGGTGMFFVDLYSTLVGAAKGEVDWRHIPVLNGIVTQVDNDSELMRTQSRWYKAHDVIEQKESSLKKAEKKLESNPNDAVAVAAFKSLQDKWEEKIDTFNALKKDIKTMNEMINDAASKEEQEVLRQALIDLLNQSSSLLDDED